MFLQAALALFGMIGGPQLGLYMLGVFFPWANKKVRHGLESQENIFDRRVNKKITSVIRTYAQTSLYFLPGATANPSISFIALIPSLKDGIFRTLQEESEPKLKFVKK